MCKNSEIQADIRNKLSPIKNLLTLLKVNKFSSDNLELNILIEEEIKNASNSVNYLSNFLKETL